MAAKHLNYRLARLCRCKRWYIEFYAHDPLTGALGRKREYISHIPAENRLQTAKLLIQEINYKLINGWSPFLPDSQPIKAVKLLEALQQIYKLKTTGAESRTVTTYRSRVKTFTDWLNKTGQSEIYIHQFTKQIAVAYMDYLRLRGLSNRTYNGYLTDMRTFFNALAERELIRVNYFKDIKMLKESDKNRNAFTATELQKLQNYLQKADPHFLLCCYYCYYAILRPVEICRLKVSDINLEQKIITISPQQSKNDKAQIIPILPALEEMLQRLKIKDAPAGWYLVSRCFRPGPVKLRENEISRKFKKVAALLQLPEHTTFYSLKDTIAERLISAGYDIKFIQRFFRHHSITITDAYMSKFNPVMDPRLIDKFPTF